MESPELIERLQAFSDRCAFNRWLGMRITSVSNRGIELVVAWKDDFMASPERQSVHGGILASLVDSAGDYAIAAVIGRPIPTVDLRIDYHRPATRGGLRAESRIVHIGKTLATAETRIIDENDRLIATGKAVYFVGQT